MDSVFELAAKLTIDSKQYERGVSDAFEAIEKLGDAQAVLSADAPQIAKTLSETWSTIGTATEGTTETARKSISEYKKDVLSLAATYQQAGMNQADAMKKAYQEIDKSQYDMTEESKKHTKTFSSGWGDAIASIAAVAQKTFPVVADAVGKATSAVGSLVKKSVESYSEFEQLKGGIETLFGDSAVTVLDNASKAAETMGVAANDYLKNATGLAATLIQATSKVEQTNIEELEARLAEEYKAKKAQLEDDFEMQKDFAEKSIKLTKEANRKEEEQTKKSNSNRLYSLQEANRKEKEQTKKSNSDRLDSLRDANRKEEEQTKKSNSDRLDSLRDANRKEEEEQSEATKKKLKNLKKENEATLAEMEASHKAQIEAAKRANEQIKKTPESIAEAAKLSDLLMSDMADNVAKIGTNFEDVANAYNGFSRNNFSMLDNLRIGYAGSKEEMERLLDDAERIKAANGEMASYSVDNFADIVKAIHVVQEEMGIAGTAAKEANETISGSLGALKAAWDNLIAGIANKDADVGQLMAKVVERAKIALQNLIPAVSQAISAVIQSIVTTDWIALAKDILESLKQALVDAGQAILGDTGGKLMGFIVDSATVALEALSGLMDMLSKFTEWLDGGTAGAEFFKKALIVLAAAIAAVTVAQWAFNAAMGANPIGLIIAGIVALIAIIAILIDNFDKIKEAIGNFWDSVKETFAAVWQTIIDIKDKIVGAIADLGSRIASGMQNALNAAWKSVVMLLGNIRRAFAEFIAGAVNFGRDLIENFVQGIKERIQKIIDAIKGIAQSIRDFIGFSEPKKGPLSGAHGFHTFAPDMMDLFAEGVKQNEHVVTDQIGKSFDFGSIGSISANAVGATSARAQTAPAQSTIQVEATIQLDGATLWRGILPAKQRAESLEGAKLVGY